MNKPLATVLILAFGLAAFGLQPAPTPKDARGVASDDGAIRARCDAFAAAWNKHDPAAMAAIWATDGDLINPWNRVAKGRAAVQALFTDEHAVVMRDSTFKNNISSIRRISDSVAIVDWDVTLTNVKTPDGSKDLPHHIAVVFQKDKSGTGGVWMIEAARPYVFSTGPSPAHDTKKPAAEPNVK